MRHISVLVALGCLVASALGSVSWNSLVHSDVFSVESDLSRSRSGHAAVLLNEFTALLEDSQVLGEAYEKYLNLHDKNYGEDDDQLAGANNDARLQAFKNALIRVAKHNLDEKDGKHSWVRGINHFSDMTANELRRYNGHAVNMTAAMRHFGEPTHVDFGLTQQSSKDWRNDKGVSPVKNQGQCGSCVSFATIGSLESASLIAGKSLVLSEQELVDCARKSCDGGDWPFAYDYMKKNGVTTGSSYPYTSGKSGKAGKCASSGKSRAIYVGSYGYVSPQTESGIVSAIAKAPIVAGVAVDDEWYDYKSGVYQGLCADNLNHAVLLVGYTPSTFIIKNSWGSWGENGFMNLPRGENKCQVNEDTVWMKTK